MKKLRIDFNPYNRDRLREVLDEQLSQGFKLEKAHPNLGYLTFMPVESNEVITYKIAIQQTYDSEFSEPWIGCGTVGSWEIFRFDGDGEKHVPKLTEQNNMSEEQIFFKRSKRNLVCGILLIIISLLWLGFDIPYMIKSAAYLVNWLSRTDWILQFCWLVLGITNIVEYFNYPQKKGAQDKSVWSKRKWFLQYVMPWIYSGLALAFIISTIAWVLAAKEKPITLPDERLPFSEKAETGTVTRSLAGNIYRYDGGEIYQYDRAFLYDVRSEKLAERLFEEAAEDDPYGEWQNGRFYYHDRRTEISADKYENLDRILSCTDDHQYDLLHGMVMVQHGDQVLGYCYDKDEYTEEEFLAELNDFYGKTTE